MVYNGDGSNWFYAFTYSVLILLLNKSPSWVVTVMYDHSKDFKFLLQGTHKIPSSELLAEHNRQTEWLGKLLRKHHHYRHCVMKSSFYEYFFECCVCVCWVYVWYDGCVDVQNSKIEISPLSWGFMVERNAVIVYG